VFNSDKVYIVYPVCVGCARSKALISA